MKDEAQWENPKLGRNNHPIHGVGACPRIARHVFDKLGSGPQSQRDARVRAAKKAIYKNPLLQLLTDLWVATQDPVFERALVAMDAYGCANPRKHPGKRIKVLETLLDHNGAIGFCVEAELEEQVAKGKRSNIKAACRSVALSCATPRSSLDATVKHVERIYRQHKRNKLPLGDTGRMLTIARVHCPRGRLSLFDIEFVADSRLVRQLLYSQQYVLLATAASDVDVRRWSLKLDQSLTAEEVEQSHSLYPVYWDQIAMLHNRKVEDESGLSQTEL